ncbi:MAG: hypothetical protein HOQ45_20290 [Nocardioidaceae bacterium]|nr:hypothetical protein [Nocardioidaceae bacterium]
MTTTVTPTNVFSGPADVWTGNFGATEPPNALAAPGVGWTNSGATAGGTTATIAQTYFEHEVDQVDIAVGARRTKLEITAATTFGEPTLANLRRALNQATSAATKLEISGDHSNAEPNYAAILMQGPGPNGAPRLFIVRKVLSVENVGYAQTKDGLTVVQATFKGFYISPSVAPFVIDDTQA